MENFPQGGVNHKTIENSQNSFPSEGLSRLGGSYWLWLRHSYWNRTKFTFCFLQNSKARWHYQKTSSSLNQKNNLKYLKENDKTNVHIYNPDQNKPRARQNWTLQRFWNDPHGQRNPASWNLWPFHQRRRLLRLKCTDSPAHPSKSRF